MERELVFELSEIQHLWIVCTNQKCKAEFRIPVDNEKIPSQCPVCTEKWPMDKTGLSSALERFQDAVGRLATLKARIVVADSERKQPGESTAKKG